jgi:acyl-coenzyme A synthetase/AMP-(fatty) acid ligase/acyl carrier protein
MVVKQPSRLIQTLVQKAVTRLVLVPSQLRVLLETDIDFRIQLPKLKHWFSSGEALSIELCQLFSERVPQGTLFNLYGSSEVSADVTWFDTRTGNSLGCVPIGRPIANTQAYILDADLQPLPIGASGELYIGGAGLARGYLNRPELTKERFIANPFSAEPEALLFKTGDLARYLPDGNIEFLNRLDQQVKIRGFRIELGEIEAVLRQHPAIREAVVVTRQDNFTEKRLAAYIVPHHEKAPSINGLRSYIEAKLPAYMVPASFVHLDALPLMPNGKIDRLALTAPNQARLVSDELHATMPDELERQLVKVWEKVLGIQPISIRDNFFELGGDSLQAVRLFSEMEKIFDKNLSLTLLLEAPTIQELANRLQENHFH